MKTKLLVISTICINSLLFATVYTIPISKIKGDIQNINYKALSSQSKEVKALPKNIKTIKINKKSKIVKLQPLPAKKLNVLHKHVKEVKTLPKNIKIIKDTKNKYKVQTKIQHIKKVKNKTKSKIIKFKTLDSIVKYVVKNYDVIKNSSAKKKYYGNEILSFAKKDKEKQWDLRTLKDIFGKGKFSKNDLLEILAEINE